MFFDTLTLKFHSTTAMTTKTDPIPLDKLLVARVKQGDIDAFNQVVSRYWGLIFCRVYRLLKNRQDTEEVTQDTFIRAHKGLEAFRGEASLSTWILQIATNLAYNKYWYWWRRKRDVSLSLDNKVTPHHLLTLQEILPSEEADPSQSVLVQEFIERVRECMQQLSPKHREILRLRNGLNFSYEAIAEKLSISVGTVKSRIARAREKLREKMGEDFK